MGDGHLGGYVTTFTPRLMPRAGVELFAPPLLSTPPAGFASAHAGCGITLPTLSFDMCEAGGQLLPVGIGAAAGACAGTDAVTAAAATPLAEAIATISCRESDTKSCHETNDDTIGY